MQPGSQSWVAAPPAGKRPRGTVHFLGGAFAGAAPQVLYNLLMTNLAAAGYTVVATPYEVTFKHADCAKRVKEQFDSDLEALRAAGRRAWVPEKAPVCGVGHSNGALLHLLIGSLYQAPAAANVVISFNNKQVSDAIPIPGFLDGLQPTVAAARAARLPPLPLPSAEQLLSAAAAALPPALLDPKLVERATPALQQFGSVVNEVGDGITNFTPTPSESRALVRESYSVPKTLLVRFANDSIDETPEMAAVVTGKFPRDATQLVLPGTHLTPCGTDVKWQVGSQFTPLDALAMGAKALQQMEAQRLADRIVAWLDAACPPPQ